MKKSLFITIILIVTLLFSACSSTTASTSVKIEENKTASIEITAVPVPTSTPVPEDGYKSDGKIHVYIVGEGQKITTPDSSFIQYIVYYPESKHMIINMNGKDYVFANISSSLWNDFKNASSKGSFYNEYIRGNTDYYVNGYNTDNGEDIIMEYVN